MNDKTPYKHPLITRKTVLIKPIVNKVQSEKSLPEHLSFASSSILIKSGFPEGTAMSRNSNKNQQLSHTTLLNQMYKDDLAHDTSMKAYMNQTHSIG